MYAHMDARLPMTYDEAVQRAQALISNRDTDELDRRALEVLLRYAARGRRGTASHVDSQQHFVKARSVLQSALEEIDSGLAKSVTHLTDRVALAEEE